MHHGDELYWSIVVGSGVIVVLLAATLPIVERYKRWKFDRETKLRDLGGLRR